MLFGDGTLDAHFLDNFPRQSIHQPRLAARILGKSLEGRLFEWLPRLCCVLQQQPAHFFLGEGGEGE